MLVNLKIGSRIALGFSLVLLLASSMTLFSIYELSAFRSGSSSVTGGEVDSAVVVLELMLGATVVTGVLIAWHLKRTIVYPLAAGISTIGVLVQGNLNREFKTTGNNELGNLLAGVQTMISKLRGVIAGVKISADGVAMGSHQLYTTSHDLREDSRQLSAQITQIVAALAEVSLAITDVANNAALASEASRKASATAIDGKSLVDANAEDMVALSQTIGQAARTIEELGESSKMIGDIVSVINDIADQTNLLALNAAIEAARAGEQGRGFAVVADEVRKLAERTGQATKVIASRIASIRDGAEESVSVIRQSSNQVATGVGMAKDASLALQSIVDVSVVAMEMVGRIAAAAEQQSVAVGQVTQNMETIAGISSRATDSALKIGDASECLSKSTDGLKEVISFFKGTREEAEDLVQKAINYIKEFGKNEAFAEINNPQGKFTNRDLYIFVYDMNGTCISHGRDINKIGRNEIALKDANNVFFVRERVELAKAQGKGWQHYQTTNPATKKIEDKVAYIERLGDYIVGSGAYS